VQSIKLVNGDLAFDGNDLAVLEGVEELAQCCRITIGTNRGEWFLNPDMGIDFNVFLGKQPNEDQMREELRQGLLQEPRISTVDAIEIQPDRAERKQTVAFRATGANGEQIGEEVSLDAG